MCKVIKVSPNSYYTWIRNHSKTKRSSAVIKLRERIKSIFYENKEIYGSVKVQESLKREGLHYSRSYVARLMKDMKLKSVVSKQYKVCTTDSNHQLPISNNQLNRGFSCDKLGEKWVSDITYIKVKNHWNYLTTIIDLADRKVVGWSLSEDMTTKNTVKKAWLMAYNNRKITGNHIFHSDRGVQYASKEMSRFLFFNGKISQSMSRKGNCWDNAVAESFFKSIKYEWTNRFNYQNHQQLYSSVNEYIKWYNTKRINGTLGYLTPLEREIQLKNSYKSVA